MVLERARPDRESGSLGFRLLTDAGPAQQSPISEFSTALADIGAISRFDPHLCPIPDSNVCLVRNPG
jgi:hypothetical protein